MPYDTAYNASLVACYTALEQARVLVDSTIRTPALRRLLDPMPGALTPTNIERDLTELRDYVFSQMGAT